MITGELLYTSKKLTRITIQIHNLLAQKRKRKKEPCKKKKKIKNRTLWRKLDKIFSPLLLPRPLFFQFLFTERAAGYNSKPLIYTLEVKHVGAWQLPNFFYVFILGQAYTAFLSISQHKYKKKEEIIRKMIIHGCMLIR